MIAHIGIQVSDIDESKKFYAHALKPIGYQVLREYGVTAERPVASAGLGEPPRADL
jgi:catechol 2,3-dioxygenase-like lactoylglutathione lyase family enzyme